ncbi:uncharacterized protein [Miscanthus floridulus]|uniref:uncharacterized protein n=1 Tax=Miscanthus floridulus TaxID=154761 RepID=UPI003459B753
MESQPEKWRYGVPMADQPKLRPLLEALERLRSRSLTAAVVVVAFHRQRLLPLMAQRQCLFEMTLDEPINGVRLSAVALSDEEILCRVRETVEGRLRSSGLTPFLMCPSRGYISLGMRDVRASPPPIPKDAEWRAANRAHAEAYKERKDAEETRHKRKSLECDELVKHRRQQRHDGLPVEPSPSPSSTDSLNDDDESEVGRGSLDHLPDVRGTALRALVSGPAFLGGGGENASGLAIARPGAKADTPEAWALGKRAISPMGSMAEVERVTAGATQQPPRRVEGALESGEGRLAPANTGAAEAPTLAPCKALKVSTSSTARWVVEAQATIQHGAASARANPEEPIAQGEATEAATEQAGEEALMPREAEAHESDEAKAPLVAKATEGEAEAPRTSEAKVAEARAPRTTEAEVVEARALGTTEADAVEASVGATKPVA